MEVTIPPSTVLTSKKGLEQKPRPKLEVADIFRRYGEQYRASNNLSKKQHAVMNAVIGCRTGDLGYHVDVCDTCNYTEHAYNSCRDRHCPKCQGIARRKWVQRQLDNVLPIPYYHVVFTLPHKINTLCSFNKELIYNLLFDSAAKTLLQFGEDSKWLGALIGFFGILHTWGGKLWQHNHCHFIVTGGGLSPLGKWVEPKYKGKFMFPVHAISEVFRGKFIEGLKAAYYRGDLVIPDALKHLHQAKAFEKWVNLLVGRNWVVYAKSSFSTPQETVTGLGNYIHKTAEDDNRLISEENSNIEREEPKDSSGYLESMIGYLGRYSHRAGICNDQLISEDSGKVRFKYKNYRKKGRWEEAVLPAEKFIERFMMHVLPQGVHRIRHYGLLANGKCKAMIKKARELLAAKGKVVAIKKQPIEKQKCPQCQTGGLHTIVAVFPFGSMVFGSNLLLVQRRALYGNTS